MGIFARILRDTLIHHRDAYPDGAYSDPTWYPLRKIGIASEIIDRLKHAVVTPASATLSVHDLEVVIADLNCSPQEQRMLHLALISQAIESLFQKRFKRAGLEVETASELAEIVFHLLMEQSSEKLETIARGEHTMYDAWQQRIEHIMPLLDSLNQIIDAYQDAMLEGLIMEQMYWRSVGMAGIEALLLMLPGDASELRLNLTASRNTFN